MRLEGVSNRGIGCMGWLRMGCMGWLGMGCMDWLRMGCMGWLRVGCVGYRRLRVWLGSMLVWQKSAKIGVVTVKILRGTMKKQKKQGFNEQNRVASMRF